MKRLRLSVACLLIVGALDAGYFWWISVHHDKPCAAVTLHADNSHCESVNGLTECGFDFLQPLSWGKCVEAADGTLTCQKGDTITHYNDNSKPDAAWKVSACPAIADQIKTRGQDPEMSIPIEIRIEPNPCKGKSCT